MSHVTEYLNTIGTNSITLLIGMPETTGQLEKFWDWIKSFDFLTLNSQSGITFHLDKTTNDGITFHRPTFFTVQSEGAFFCAEKQTFRRLRKIKLTGENAQNKYKLSAVFTTVHFLKACHKLEI